MNDEVDTTELDPDFSYDASNEIQVSARQRKTKRKQSSRDLFTKEIMSTPKGRAWMFELLVTLQSNAVILSDNARRDAFMQGRQSVAKELEAEINRACPENYILMLSDRLKANNA